MKELTGNLFNYIGLADAICITTNGFVKSNGECVMGKGCAKTVTELFPGIAKVLGDSIKSDGNVVIPLLSKKGTVICTFPVKSVSELFTGSNAVKHMHYRFKIGDRVPGWACIADPKLIEKSAIQLVELADKSEWKSIILPRPGCGAGELSWSDIKPVLDKHFDDRFFSVTFK